MRFSFFPPPVHEQISIICYQSLKQKRLGTTVVTDENMHIFAHFTFYHVQTIKNHKETHIWTQHVQTMMWGRWESSAIILTITVGHIQSYIHDSREKEHFLLHLYNYTVANLCHLSSNLIFYCSQDPAGRDYGWSEKMGKNVRRNLSVIIREQFQKCIIKLKTRLKFHCEYGSCTILKQTSLRLLVLFMLFILFFFSLFTLKKEDEHFEEKFVLSLTHGHF